MFVRKHRRHLSASAEDRDSFFKEPPARVHRLAGGGSCIVAMLADQQHALNGQPIATQSQRFVDGLAQAHAVSIGQLPPDVLARHLVDIKADELEIRSRRFAVKVVTLEQP